MQENRIERDSASRIYPQDARPPLHPMAFVRSIEHDPLQERSRTRCALTPDGPDLYRLKMPKELFGTYTLEFTARAPIPGMRGLTVSAPVTIRPSNAKAYLVPATDRNRTAFAAINSAGCAGCAHFAVLQYTVCLHGMPVCAPAGHDPDRRRARSPAAWLEEGDWKGWKRIVHERWNAGVTHVHALPAITTKQLRYIVLGDFGENLWTTEVECYE